MKVKYCRIVAVVTALSALLAVLVLKLVDKYSALERMQAQAERIFRKAAFNDIERAISQESNRLEIQDLPVRYLSDVDWGQHRLQPLDDARKAVGFNMEPNRLSDDYRFCVKEIPMEGPFNFTTKSLNPCWFNSSHQLQCIPYFYLIGVSKSGTTDLYSRINKHMHVFNDGWKEKHWLDFSRYYINKESVSYYASTFSSFTEIVSQQINDKGVSDLVVGDGTPCYFFFSLYWPCYEGNRGLTQPRFTNADVIYKMNPRAKILLSMRDPVKRLFSRYMTLLKKNASSPLFFHQSTSRAIDVYTSCIKVWSARHCAYNGTLYRIVKTRLQEGMYSVFLRDWLKVFPRDQILIFKFEDYVSDLPKHMKSIFKFLELPPISNSTLHAILTRGAKNTLPPSKGKMMPETIDLLQKFYRPYNKELQEILGDSSWSWGYE